MPKTPHFMPKAPRRIAILAYPGVVLLDLAGPLEVFVSANEAASRNGQPMPYEISTISREARVKTTSDVIIETKRLPEPDEVFDTLIIAGGFGVDTALADEVLVSWLVRMIPLTRRVASVCSGAFLLAATGSLNGRRAVTHWARCAQFRQLFPQVKLDPDPIFIRDGKLWTSAGISAGIDLALALVEDDLGHKSAMDIARELVVFLKRPGGQSQFSTVLDLQAFDASFDTLHTWIANNLDQDLSLSRLAKQTKMSPRSFSRHYLQMTGNTPAKTVEILRVEAAKRLLESGANLADTARRCGYGSPDAMRRIFMRVVAVSPKDYRERFSS